MSNKYTYAVPFTEEELFDSYVNQGMSQDEIAVKFGTTQKVVWRAMHKCGIPTRKAAKRNQWGENNSSWRGGRVLAAKTKQPRGHKAEFNNGYFYLIAPDHPNANKSGYVAEHIAVAVSQRGHPLVKGEVVHHINLNKHDNSPENLIISDRQQHANWHRQLEEIAVMFMLEGKIGFDPAIGYYRIDEHPANTRK
jgi:hypothetical protein